MNFNNRNVSLIKFTDNIRFAIDAESLISYVKNAFPSLEGTSAFRTVASITDPVTNRKEEVAVVFYFRGFFRNTVIGSVWKPEGILAKDYDVFEKNLPYILSFNLADLTPFNLAKP